jgi:hypothetical protein
MEFRTKSNMYEWITATRNYVGGKCEFGCNFCYVEDLKKYPNVKARYAGEYRLIEKELAKNEGSGKTIFVQDCSDLFAPGVPSQFIERILEHCRKFDNTKRFKEFIGKFPAKTILGISLESNRDYGLTKAPIPRTRTVDFYNVQFPYKIINIEPIIDFDLEVMVNWIKQIKPEFVSIGADSKHHSFLIEPSREKIVMLINELKKFTEVKVKSNLSRLLKD